MKTMGWSASSGKAGGGRKSSAPASMADTARWSERERGLAVDSGNFSSIPSTGDLVASRRSFRDARPRSGRPWSAAIAGLPRARVSGWKENRGRRRARAREKRKRSQASSWALSPPRRQRRWRESLAGDRRRARRHAAASSWRRQRFAENPLGFIEIRPQSFAALDAQGTR